ncbi:MAG: DNA polymerase domain-containing protein [Anaerolineaceae bacterium]|jgi:DNA polymerase-2
MSAEIFRGWLLDLYINQQDGVNLWFISETDDRRVCFTQPFPVIFYAAGDHSELRRLWKQLHGHEDVTALRRIQKQDVFVAAPVDVMEVSMSSPSAQVKLFHQLEQEYPTLTWYDADITIQSRYIARYGAFPLALCELTANAENQIQRIRPLNSRWDLMPAMPPLRILEIVPNMEPSRAPVTALRVRSDRLCYFTDLKLDSRLWLRAINDILREYDPDIIVTDWGDAWVIPFLLAQSDTANVTLALNRDPGRAVRWQKETSYFSYGHIIYRPEEAHLFGRCHIDRKSAMMWSDYSLAGTLEMARVTTLPIEKAARVSPGQGISAMQVITALEKDVLVPYQKRQIEEFKIGMQLIQSDRGGMVYQPKVGLHTDVAEIDFVSMYPAVIIKGNISPEVPLPDVLEPASEELGVVPLTLRPLYDKRVSLKKLTRTYPPEHPMVETLMARSQALKWLLVVCFGFLGYKNARYGRIEAHEAVTKGGREVLLRAKEVAEAEGFEVLHMYVDSLWVKRKGANRPEHFSELLEKILLRTGLTINLDGIFRWVAFLPSKTDVRIPIANRYFGVFQSGEMKMRGLESRRRDTPLWIADVQRRMIHAIGQATTCAELPQVLIQAFKLYYDALDQLRSGKVSPDQLVINGKVSYSLDAYKVTTASVRAARQLEAAGISVRPGMRIRFLFTTGEPDVFAWDTGDFFDPAKLDKAKYIELLAKIGASVFLPFGIDPPTLQEWSQTGRLQLALSI